MAHGENAEQGGYTKRRTHRKERRAAVEQIRAEVEGQRPRKVRRRRDPAAIERRRQRIRDAIERLEMKLGW